MVETKGGRVGPGKQFITLYLDKSLVEQCDRLAAAQDISRSKYLVNIIEESIAQDGIAVQAMTNPVVSSALMSAFANPEVLRAITGVMRSELSDDQLNLFQRAMTTTASMAEEAGMRSGVKLTPRGGVARKNKKRGKR
jgi:hypothetical protein